MSINLRACILQLTQTPVNRCVTCWHNKTLSTGETFYFGGLKVRTFLRLTWTWLRRWAKTGSTGRRTVSAGPGAPRSPPGRACRGRCPPSPWRPAPGPGRRAPPERSPSHSSGAPGGDGQHPPITVHLLSLLAVFFYWWINQWSNVTTFIYFFILKDLFFKFNVKIVQFKQRF